MHYLRITYDENQRQKDCGCNKNNFLSISIPIKSMQQID